MKESSTMNLTINDLRELLASPREPSQADTLGPWKIGSPYFIRTVTHHYTGKLVAVHAGEIVLTDAAWIADNGRFAQAVATGSFDEIEPYPDGAEVVIGRGSILDAVVVSFPVPRSQK